MSEALEAADDEATCTDEATRTHPRTPPRTDEDSSEDSSNEAGTERRRDIPLFRQGIDITRRAEPCALTNLRPMINVRMIWPSISETRVLSTWDVVRFLLAIRAASVASLYIIVAIQEDSVREIRRALEVITNEQLSSGTIG